MRLLAFTIVILTLGLIGMLSALALLALRAASMS